MPPSNVVDIDSSQMRLSGREALSVALMDARNHSLHLFGILGNTLAAAGFAVPQAPDANPPLWELGHIGWFQEWWIARNTQRLRGVACDAEPPRLVSIEPQADAWWGDMPVAERWAATVPDLASTHEYLLATLETSLELLDKADGSDAALYFFRLALFHEDMRGEELVTLAQTLGLPLPIAVPGPQAPREPLLVAAARWQLGVPGGRGFCFDNEALAHGVDVPEFEIDAQPVSWAQYVEFVDDGGYDRAEFWHPDGWTWLQGQATGNRARAPRYVDQIGVASGAVMQTRFGTARRMLGGQPAMHVSWWEADAWCRWAGRRLPAEVEWEMAAHSAARRGFRWGEVWEWTGSTARAYPGFVPGPWRDYSEPCFGSHKVLRGASFATRTRVRSPKFRRFALPERDELFAGFRSCAL